ncbi:MAG: alkaline phosphatase family protein, partial [Treponema sp.]|nr:alkaline phosphatase family protein [Treponema sp.]
YSTAGVSWPVSGNHPSIDYLIAEYWTQGPDDTYEACFARSGSSPAILDIARPYFPELVMRMHPSPDYFIMKCTCDIIRKYKPEFFMIHPANIDSARHEFGVFNGKVDAAILETDQWIGDVMDALEEAGVRDKTNFFLISDHGQMDIKRVININVLLADYGLIRYDEKGNFIDWDAYSLSAGMSAHVFLKNRNDQYIRQKTMALLNHLCDEGIYGISRVFTKEEARKEEHLGGDFSFVLETDGYTSFGDNWKRPLVKTFDLTDYRYGRATHGYLPSRGPQPVLAAAGPDIRPNTIIESARLVDLAPTFAKLMGVNLDTAEGVIIKEMLL